MGNRHSIKTMVQKKNPDVFFNGCQCHVVHNTSAAAASAFTEATGFDVSDILVDLYYWFDHSNKRKNLLRTWPKTVGGCSTLEKGTILYSKSADNLIWILYKLDDLLLLMMVFGLGYGMFLLLVVVSGTVELLYTLTKSEEVYIPKGWKPYWAESKQRDFFIDTL